MNANELMHHKRVHIEERIFFCKYCEKTFYKMKLHRRHKRSHINDNSKDIMY